VIDFIHLFVNLEALTIALIFLFIHKNPEVFKEQKALDEVGHYYFLSAIAGLAYVRGTLLHHLGYNTFKLESHKGSWMYHFFERPYIMIWEILLASLAIKFRRGPFYLLTANIYKRLSGSKRTFLLGIAKPARVVIFAILAKARSTATFLQYRRDPKDVNASAKHNNELYGGTALGIPYPYVSELPNCPSNLPEGTSSVLLLLVLIGLTMALFCLGCEQHAGVGFLLHASRANLQTVLFLILLTPKVAREGWLFPYLSYEAVLRAMLVGVLEVAKNKKFYIAVGMIMLNLPPLVLFISKRHLFLVLGIAVKVIIVLFLMLQALLLYDLILRFWSLDSWDYSWGEGLKYEDINPWAFFQERWFYLSNLLLGAIATTVFYFNFIVG